MEENGRKSNGESRPPETPGKKLGEKIRQKTNELTDAEREALMERGMSIIYGGDGSKVTADRG